MTAQNKTGPSSSALLTALREHILQGKTQPGDMMPTVREVSSQYNLAQKTVIRAFKGLEAEGLVASEPRQGYRVMGRALDPNLGCPFAYVSLRDRGGKGWDRFHQVLMSGLEHAAGKNGWTVLSVGSWHAADAEIIEQLKQSKVWGAILENSNQNFLGLIRKLGIPAVLMDAWREDEIFDTVLQDNYRGGYLAGRELIKRGCTHMAWLGKLDAYAHSRERFGGAAAALTEAGLSLGPDMCFYPDAGTETEENGSLNSWRNAARRMLSRPDRPDGVFALWGRMAQAVKMAADDLGLVVGQDFHMVGWVTEEEYDEIFLPVFSSGPVPSVITWRGRNMAEIAVKRLAERRTDQDTPPLRINVPVRVKKGETD